jgi:hypothetical protein
MQTVCDLSSANALLLRGTMPHKLFNRPQLVRLTVPIVTLDLPPGHQVRPAWFQLFGIESEFPL